MASSELFLDAFLVLLFSISTGTLILRACRVSLNFLEGVGTAASLGLCIWFFLARYYAMLFPISQGSLVAIVGVVLVALGSAPRRNSTRTVGEFDPIYSFCAFTVFLYLAWNLLQNGFFRDGAYWISYNNVDLHYHVAITQQILAKNLQAPFSLPHFPPTPIAYPWGGHLLAAAIAKVFVIEVDDAWKILQFNAALSFLCILSGLLSRVTESVAAKITGVLFVMAISLRYSSYFFISQPRGASLAPLFASLILMAGPRNKLQDILAALLLGFSGAVSSKPEFAVVIGLGFYALLHAKELLKWMPWLCTLAGIWFLSGGNIFLGYIVGGNKEVIPTEDIGKLELFKYYLATYLVYSFPFLMSIFLQPREKLPSLFKAILQANFLFTWAAFLGLVFQKHLPLDFTSLFYMPDIDNFMYMLHLPLFAYLTLAVFFHSQSLPAPKRSFAFFYAGFLIYFLIFPEANLKFRNAIPRLDLFYYLLPGVLFIAYFAWKRVRPLHGIALAFLAVPLLTEVILNGLSYTCMQTKPIFSKAEMEAVAWLKQQDPSSAVILSSNFNEEQDPAPYFTRIPVYLDYPMTLTTNSIRGRRERTAEVKKYFEGENPALLTQLLSQYRKVYVYLDKRREPHWSKLAQKGIDRFENEGVLIFVLGAQGAS